MNEWSDGSLRDGIVRALGGSIQRPIAVRLGHPVTRAIDAQLGVDTAQPGMVWVHGDGLGGEGIALALNSGTYRLSAEDRIFGSWVLVRRNEAGTYVIEGMGGERQAEYVHDVKVRPQASVVVSQFDYGLLQPTQPPSLRCLVSEAMYRTAVGIKYYTVKLTEDFTARLPTDLDGVNVARAVLVQIDPLNGALSYVNGDFFDKALSHSAAFADLYPQPEGGMLAVGWVKLRYGQTRLVQIDDILPGQELISIMGGGGVTVREIDGTPSINANTIEFSNARVSDQGSGVTRVNLNMTVKEIDGDPSIEAHTIEVTNGRLTNPATGVARIDAGVTVREIDGSPSLAASIIEFPNSSVTDQGSGVVRVDPGAMTPAYVALDEGVDFTDSALMSVYNWGSATILYNTGMYSAGAPTRFTPPATGIYQVSLHWFSQPETASYYVFAIDLTDGTTITPVISADPDAFPEPGGVNLSTVSWTALARVTSTGWWFQMRERRASVADPTIRMRLYIAKLSNL